MLYEARALGREVLTSNRRLVTYADALKQSGSPLVLGSLISTQETLVHTLSQLKISVWVLVTSLVSRPCGYERPKRNISSC